VSAVVNGIGAAATGVVGVIVIATKFAEGAWAVVVAIPLLVTSSEDASNCRSLVAFWCGTRAYRSLFERYERGGLADELAHLSVSDDPDRWRRMTDLIDDELLNVFTINATPGQFGRALRDAFGGHADRVIVPAPAPFGRYTPAALGLAAADPRLGTP